MENKEQGLSVTKSLDFAFDDEAMLRAQSCKMLEHLEEADNRDFNVPIGCEKSVISDATSALMTYLDKRNCEDTVSVKSQIFHFKQKVNYWMNKSRNKVSVDKQSGLVKQDQSATESYYENTITVVMNLKTRTIKN